jgi:ribosomal protein S18 acetylase RimI-like enzyme
VIHVLSEQLREFWYAVADLNPVFRRTPWGLVKTDARYPIIWDANQAAVYEPAPALTLGSIRAALLPALEEARAEYEHIEFWDTTANPALTALRAGGSGHPPDVLMVFDRDGTARPEPAVDVREIEDPDEAFWSWYATTRREFGAEFTDDVIDQLLLRDREVFRPAGLRWFVGFVDGRMAGFASLLSAVGVGYLDNVVTMPGYRRRGIASATVTRAVVASADSGDAVVHLLAERGGAPQALYERLGFRTVAEIESFTRKLEP